jgi:hypothetical protein
VRPIELEKASILKRLFSEKAGYSRLNRHDGFATWNPNSGSTAKLAKIEMTKATALLATKESLALVYFTTLNPGPFSSRSIAAASS